MPSALFEVLCEVIFASHLDQQYIFFNIIKFLLNSVKLLLPLYRVNFPL